VRRAFDKWETVGGVRFAGTISIFQNGKKLAESTVEQTKVNKVNSGIKPSDLAIKPTNLSPVMSQP
jgi:hypothetical protein